MVRGGSRVCEPVGQGQRLHTCWPGVCDRLTTTVGPPSGAAARAFALSLLEKRPALGCDGDTPSPSEVVGACRHLPLYSVS